MGVSAGVIAAAAMILLLGMATGPAPAQSPAPRPLGGLHTWAVYYGAAPEAAAELARFDLVVLDPARHPPLPAVKRHGTLVLMYVSLGEVNVHHAAYGAIAGEPWVLGANPNWPEARRLDVRAPAYARWLVEQVAGPAVRAPANGLFLDTADTPIELERADPARFRGMASGVERVVRELRSAYPHAVLVMNGGVALAASVGPVLDGIAVESVLSNYDFATKTYGRRADADARRRIETVRRVAAQGLPVLTLEYAPSDEREWIARLIAASRAERFVPYVATIDLERVSTVTLSRSP